ncbi:hypothetical protein BBOV_I004140 [Babesia bovis T2Bo]|uniref:Uncharacterized protein n=1 Tax=Babesia bovis TaxID=5865 RepID=A7AWR7_BABBO|nr:hypothetical protein BBOV_I004140 [Babesia bovis T2Bo]EDO05495.1 hypothetical protein BBOV_I004140 [Babesia bovis T2Bo]BAN64781.1 hypothetical protein [Babesia bovis]|eukprot:XP_001609063.1 hypothetical protein [Babesia bovis T2Bo]
MKTSSCLLLCVITTLSFFCAAIELASDIDGVDVADSVNRHLSAASRRKFAHSNDVSLNVSAPSVTTMDDDDEDDEEDDDDNDYQVEHKSTAIKSENKPNLKAMDDSSDAIDGSKESSSNSQRLLMNSLPSHKDVALESPKSALDVIANFFREMTEIFHQRLNEFFDNIDKQIKANSALPLLEQGDTFF